jgi:hypothetical protein
MMLQHATKVIKHYLLRTFAKERDICEALGFEKVAECRGQVAAKAVPFETELLLLRVHTWSDAGSRRRAPSAVARPRPLLIAVYKKPIQP